MSNGEVTLPRKLALFYLAVERAPMTNFKSLNGEVLAYGTATFLALASIFKWSIDENILYAWLFFLAGKIGFAMGGALGKRVTSPEYVAAKAAGKATGAPLVGQVEGDMTMTTTTERSIPAPSRRTDLMPQMGVKPTSPEVLAAVETIAAQQRDPRLPSPLDDERDA